MADALLSPVTIGSALARGRAMLGRAGIETPRLDAELLLAEALDVGRERLLVDRDLTLDPGGAASFEALLERRVHREPVAYILGRRHFRRLTLHVDRRVLIPRPETELLVEIGLTLPAGARVADVGTGSGAVALALADERPDLIVRGLDIDPAALELARANGARLGMVTEFAQADLLDGDAYDAVLANLPYVRTDAELEPEITGYEPARALFAGADGLEVIRRLIDMIAAAPGPLPLLALEIDPDQAPEVAGRLGGAGYAGVEVLADLAGRERVAVGRR